MYIVGRGVPANFDIAIGYFKASAFHSHPRGPFNLGNCYFSGQGPEQSYKDAIGALQLAAEKGHENATWRLAALCSAGERKHQKAFDCLGLGLIFSISILRDAGSACSQTIILSANKFPTGFSVYLSLNFQEFRRTFFA